MEKAFESRENEKRRNEMKNYRREREVRISSLPERPANIFSFPCVKLIVSLCCNVYDIYA